MLGDPRTKGSEKRWADIEGGNFASALILLFRFGIKNAKHPLWHMVRARSGLILNLNIFKTKIGECAFLPGKFQDLIFAVKVHLAKIQTEKSMIFFSEKNGRTGYREFRKTIL